MAATASSEATSATAAVSNLLKEGKASISNEKGQVFYNPAQVQNRDLSVAAIRVFTKILSEERRVKGLSVFDISPMVKIFSQPKH